MHGEDGICSKNSYHLNENSTKAQYDIANQQQPIIFWTNLVAAFRYHRC